MKSNAKKFIIPAIILAVLAAAAVIIILVVNRSEEYRLVKVKSFDGTVTVQRNLKQTLSAFNEMNLISGDEVSVKEKSFLELLADGDKHILAEENTGFSLVSSGTSESGMLTINLLYGKSLFTIDNKLGENSFFEVKTPNATLSVRGTSFSVEYSIEKQETTVEVLEGKVLAVYYGKEKLLEKGETIRINPSSSEQSNTPANPSDTISFDNKIEALFLFSNCYLLPSEAESASSDIECNLSMITTSFDEEIKASYFYPGKVSGGSTLDKSSNEFYKNYIEPYSAEIRQFFDENKTQVLHDIENDNNYITKDVTEWFPDTVTISGENGDYNFKITSVQMGWTRKYKYKKNMNDMSELPDEYFFDGEKYTYMGGVCLYFDGYPVN